MLIGSDVLVILWIRVSPGTNNCYKSQLMRLKMAIKLLKKQYPNVKIDIHPDVFCAEGVWIPPGLTTGIPVVTPGSPRLGEYLGT